MSFYKILKKIIMAMVLVVKEQCHSYIVLLVQEWCLLTSCIRFIIIPLIKVLDFSEFLSVLFNYFFLFFLMMQLQYKLSIC